MNDWEEKRKIRTILYSKWVLFLLLILIILVVKGTWNLYHKSEEARISKERVGVQINELHEREEFLKSGLEQLNSEKGVEAMIRQKYNVKKEGEEVAIILDPKEKEAVVPSSRVYGFFQSFFASIASIFR